MYIFRYSSHKVAVETIKIKTDTDTDMIPDNLDIVEWARKEVQRSPWYKSAYYSGGYPPETEWVCSDVIWHSLKNAWYDLKKMIDLDIKKHSQDYPRVGWKPDPNIDFRRVENLQVYFEKYSKNLTIEIHSWDIKNLKEWQPGDIVIFWAPHWHIAIISDKRNTDGVPYMIHNSAPTPREDDWLILWNEKLSPIVGHYRLNY